MGVKFLFLIDESRVLEEGFVDFVVLFGEVFGISFRKCKYCLILGGKLYMEVCGLRGGWTYSICFRRFDVCVGVVREVVFICSGR